MAKIMKVNNEIAWKMKWKKWRKWRSDRNNVKKEMAKWNENRKRNQAKNNESNENEARRKWSKWNSNENMRNNENEKWREIVMKYEILTRKPAMKAKLKKSEMAKKMKMKININGAKTLIESQQISEETTEAIIETMAAWKRNEIKAEAYRENNQQPTGESEETLMKALAWLRESGWRNAEAKSWKLANRIGWNKWRSENKAKRNEKWRGNSEWNKKCHGVAKEWKAKRNENQQAKNAEKPWRLVALRFGNEISVK